MNASLIVTKHASPVIYMGKCCITQHIHIHEDLTPDEFVNLIEEQVADIEARYKLKHSPPEKPTAWHKLLSGSPELLSSSSEKKPEDSVTINGYTYIAWSKAFTPPKPSAYIRICEESNETKSN